MAATPVHEQLKDVQQVQASHGSFAAVLGDGSVVNWGCGGGSRAVQHRLKNVQRVQASRGTFAAVLFDGSVVTWGDAE